MQAAGHTQQHVWSIHTTCNAEGHVHKDGFVGVHVS